MTDPIDGPDPDEDLYYADRARAEEVRAVAAECEGWGITCDCWGRWRARRGDDVTEYVSTSLALRALIGLPVPRKATP